MSNSAADHARAIFEEAIANCPEGEWRDFVPFACKGDAALERQVNRLLAAHAAAGDFMSRPVAADTWPSAEPKGTLCGTTVGPYKLQELLGEGGMGVVYVAEQTFPVRRQVALKLIKPGLDSDQVLARFELERQNRWR